MPLRIPETELEPLRRVDLSSPTRILVLGAPLAPIVELLRSRVPGADLDVVMAEAADAALAGPKVRVHERVDEVPPPTIVVWRPTGYEGKARERVLIQMLAAKLEPGAQVLLSTHKRRGAKRVRAMLEELIGPVTLVRRDNSGVQILSARPTGAVVRAEPDPALSVEVAWIEVDFAGQRLRFATTSSLFSKQRLDDGTRLLLDYLDASQLWDAERILDVGCGWGPIGIVLALRYPGLRVVLLDKDPLAIEFARRNVEAHELGERAQLVLADGPHAAVGPFDLVTSHLPLHVPRAELERILKEAHQQLRVGGRLICIALASYDVSPSIEAVFGEIEVAANGRTDSGHFRIYVAAKSDALGSSALR